MVFPYSMDHHRAAQHPAARPTSDHLASEASFKMENHLKPRHPPHQLGSRDIDPPCHRLIQRGLGNVQKSASLNQSTIFHENPANRHTASLVLPRQCPELRTQR